MNKHLSSFYGIYKTPLLKFLRVVVLIGLLSPVLLLILGKENPRLPLFFLNLFIMLEIFYRYGVTTIYPSKRLSDGPKKTEDVSSIAVLYALTTSSSAEEMAHKVKNYPQVTFLLEKIPLAISEFPKGQLPANVLLESAREIAEKVGGTIVTTMDVMTAYLLQVEESSHALRAKRLRTEDLLNILVWARHMYPQEESPRKFSLNFSGGGIGEGLLTGWTPETANFTRLFTGSAKASILGREAEYKQMLEGLSKSENNNVILIGEAGSGRENLVSRFVADSYSRRAPEHLHNKTVLELLAGQLLAGASDQGELEERLQFIIDEVSHAENVILYVPDFENILGVGGLKLDLSGALMPYLKTGKLPIIATMTPGLYKANLESRPLSQMFNPIMLLEPSITTAETMLMETVGDLEVQHNVIITYLALHTAAQYADRYFSNEVLPGSAIDLLKDALSALPNHQPKLYYPGSKRLMLTDEILLTNIESKTKMAVSEPTSTEKDTLLHLEEILHKHVIGQNQAISAISEAMRRLRAGLQAQNKPISFLFLGPTGVGKTQAAKTLANVYFGGESSMIRLDMSEYTSEDGVKRLLGSMPGEGSEKGELTEKVHDHPYSLILLDEFEKAHPSILNLFLQVLEDGRLTDNQGKTISFISTIIIATSNAGSDFIYQAVKNGGGESADFSSQLLSYLQQNHLFRPELINRFGSVVTFTPLSHEEVSKIAALMLTELTASMHEKDITVTFDDAVVRKIAAEAYNAQYGARPIKRYIQDTIEDMIAQKLLRNEIARGTSLEVFVGPNNEFHTRSVL